MLLSKVYEDAERRLNRNEIMLGEFQKLVDIEVVEPKQGKWLWKLADNGWKDIYCSECGWTKNVDIHVSLGYNYCPYCGAKMKGGKGNE